MAWAAKRDASMSVAEYRRWAETRPEHERWELLDGAPVLMSPPRERHQRIGMNPAGRLDSLAGPRGAVLPIVHSDEARVEVCGAEGTTGAWRHSGSTVP
jgi:Uma2 family endonuclease